MRVLVTGISRGIGFGIAGHYLSAGDTVIGSVRGSNEAVETLKSTYAETLDVITVDVRESDQVESAAKEVAARHEALDLIICSAAVNPAGRPFEVNALRDLGDEDTRPFDDLVDEMRSEHDLHNDDTTLMRVEGS